MTIVRALLLLLLAVGLVPAASGLAPDKAFRHHVRGAWSIKEGLPQISAVAITQDRDGYIWVGTQSGVARFDGVRFTTYTPENDPGLPGIYMRALLTDRRGRLWVGTYKGLARFDDPGFRTIAPADTAQFPQIDVAAIAEDAQGTIWVAAAEGVFRLDGDRLHLMPGSPAPATSLLPQRDGLYVGSRGLVQRLGPEGWRRERLPDAASSVPVNRMALVRGRLWAATGAGLYMRETGVWRAFDEVPALVGTPLDVLYPDRDGNLWIGGDAGIARLRDGRLEEFIAAGEPGGIPGLRAAFEDREGNLWLGSQWEGVIRLWDSWTERYSVAEGLHERIVWSVAPDPDGRRIWVGTNDGVSLLEDGRFRQVLRGRDLPHPQGYNLLAEPDRLWIGTRQGLVLAVPGNDGAWRIQRPAVLAPLAGLQINGIVRDGDTYWIPTSSGLFRLDGNRLRRYAQAQGLTDPRARYFHRSPDGRVRVGTQGGLFELRGDRFAPSGAEHGLPSGLDVASIAVLPDGSEAVGTLGEALWFKSRDRWMLVGDAEGMPRNSPFFLVERDGYLWAAGIRGISRVPVADLHALADGRIERVRGEMLLNERGDPMSGQQGYCCNGAGNAKGFARGATLWLPSRDGVVAMPTDRVIKNGTPPRAVIERVQVGEEWRPASAVTRVELPTDARDLSFEFTVLSFQDPKSTGIEYRLVGYDRDWRAADPFNRNARYTNLPPGDYTFEVRGTNNAGIPTPGPAQLPFSVQPRFHETRLFYVLLALLLATVVYAGYRLQQRRYRVRQQELEALVQQRTEALEIANHRLEEASQTDPLTGLRNRRYMANQIPADLAYYDRQRQLGVHREEAMVFALVDIDHFKQVNDRYGHRAGDRVLQQFAQVLGALVRTGDYVVRWGGEEFLVVFRPMSTRSLPVIGERIRAAVSGHEFDIGTGTPLRLTCSTGLSEHPLRRDEHGVFGWESMVELADQALYYVKTHGRDGWAAFRPTAKTDLVTLLQDLQAGPDEMLAQGRLELLGTKARRAADTPLP